MMTSTHKKIRFKNIDSLKLIVFDLDYTLWPFYVDTHPLPPFVKRNGCVVDRNGWKIPIYPEVNEILEELKAEGYTLAVASRTSAISEAYSLINLLNWNHYFSFKEIYPGSKVNHFKAFVKNSGISLSNMIFFDDEYRNIQDLRSIGVVSVHVKNGVTRKEIENGFNLFKEARN